MSTALYPGSFDPVHLGHLSVIDRAADAFDAVVVAVLGNPEKRAGLFPVARRVELLASSIGPRDNVRCVAFHGLTVDAAKTFDCDVVVRTGHKDDDDEWAMLAMNQLMSGTRTIFFPPAPEHVTLSSSGIRALVADGRAAAAAAHVPAAVAAALG